MVGGRWWVGLPVTAGGARWSLCCSVRRVRYRRFNCSSHGLIASGATPCPSHVPRVAATGQARAQVVWILPRILSLKRPSENLSPQELWPARPTQSAWRVHGSQRARWLVRRESLPLLSRQVHRRPEASTALDGPCPWRHHQHRHLQPTTATMAPLNAAARPMPPRPSGLTGSWLIPPWSPSRRWTPAVSSGWPDAPCAGNGRLG